jgi:hypothetical protein
MTGYLRRLALGMRDGTPNIRPMRGSLFAPDPPLASEDFQLEQETLAPSSATPHVDAHGPQATPLPAREAPRPASTAASRRPSSPTAALEALALWMETPSSQPREAPSGAGPQRQEHAVQQVETPRARAEDGEAPRSRPIVSVAARSSSDAAQLAPAPPQASLCNPGPNPNPKSNPKSNPKPNPLPAASRPERQLAIAGRSREAPPDEVHIHIGRIEVTAVQPPRPAPPPQHDATLLEEYVKRRDGRARR